MNARQCLVLLAIVLTGCAASDTGKLRARSKPEMPDQIALGAHVNYAGIADLVNDFSAAGANVYTRHGGDVIEIAYHTNGRMVQNDTRMFEDMCGQLQRGAGTSYRAEIEHGPMTRLDARSGRKIDFTGMFASLIGESMPAELESDQRGHVKRSYKEVVICPDPAGVRATHLNQEMRVLVPYFASYERCEVTDAASAWDMLCHWFIFQPTTSWVLSHYSNSEK